MSKKKGPGSRRPQQAPRRGRRKATEDIQFRPNLREADPALLQDIRQALPIGRLPDPLDMTDMVVTSYALVDEPELRGILGRPILACALFVGFAEQLGIRPDDLLGDESMTESESWWDLMSEVTPALLREDEEFLTDIVQGLSQMRPRLKRRGHHYAAGQAAMVQLLLETADEAGWRAAGLLQVLVLRSVQAGFTLDELQEGMEEVLREQELESLEAAPDDERMRELLASAEKLIEHEPTLHAYSERKLDKVWQEGFEALTSQRLKLALFSPQEVTGAVERIGEHVWIKDESNTLDFEMKPLLESLRPYVDELLTSQRMAQLRRQLKEYRDQKQTKKWHQFFVIIDSGLVASTPENVDPRVSSFALVALLMESLRAYVENLEEEE